MVKHRSPVKLHGCHLVGGLHRDWCSSDLWYFSRSHVESVPRRVMWIYIFFVCNVKYTRASYNGLLTVALSVRKRSSTVLISKPLWLYLLKNNLSVLNVWRLFCLDCRFCSQKLIESAACKRTGFLPFQTEARRLLKANGCVSKLTPHSPAVSLHTPLSGGKKHITQHMAQRTAWELHMVHNQ